jgi:hypothetical protein
MRGANVTPPTPIARSVPPSAFGSFSDGKTASSTPIYMRTNSTRRPTNNNTLASTERSVRFIDISEGSRPTASRSRAQSTSRRGCLWTRPASGGSSRPNAALRFSKRSTRPGSPIAMESLEPPKRR